MDTRRNFVTKLGTAALGGALLGGGPLCAVAGEPRTRNLRFGHWVSTDSPHHAFAARFADIVARKTHGALSIAIYPSEELGTIVEQLDAQRAGTLDFSLPTTSVLARIEPKLLVLTLPYLFTSAQDAYAVLDGPIGRRFLDGLPARGVRVLALSTNGMRNITNSKHPITTVADLAGLRIRVPPNGLSVALFRSLGARPVVLPFNRVYAALRTRQADGEENPFGNIYTAKFYEVQPYLAITRHQFEGLSIAVSEKTWRTFDGATQTAVAAAAHEAAASHRLEFSRFDAASQAKLEALGMHMTAPNLAEFKAKSQALYRQFSTVFGADLVHEVERAARS